MPQRLYVWREMERDGASYLMCSDDPDVATEGDVCIYSLAEIGKKRIVSEIKMGDSKEWQRVGVVE